MTEKQTSVAPGRLEQIVSTFDLIYADPPWRYDFSSTDSRKIENQYPTMKTDDICKMKLPTAKDCILFMWATAPKLIECLQVMEAWGFKYKTHAIWDKEIQGMGYWFRGQHELLMVGVKGNASPPAEELRIGSVIRIKRDRHSSKPDWIRDRIHAWYPEKNKLEVFAREWTLLWPKVEGWSVYGNEVKCDIAVE